jgi:hypothetical protein
VTADEIAAADEEAYQSALAFRLGHDVFRARMEAKFRKIMFRLENEYIPISTEKDGEGDREVDGADATGGDGGNI